jgi:hypothetical protein
MAVVFKDNAQELQVVTQRRGTMIPDSRSGLSEIVEPGLLKVRFDWRNSRMTTGANGDCWKCLYGLELSL